MKLYFFFHFFYHKIYLFISFNLQIRIQLAKSLNFLNNLLHRSDNIIFFLIPIYMGDDIVDFELDYVTENIKKLTTNKSSDLIHKNMTTLFPDIYENGIFEILAACYTKKDFEISFERKLNFCGNDVWLRCHVSKYKKGITVTCSEISKLKHTEHKLRELNKQLEFKNATLKEAEIISKSASFRWSIKKNTWVLSENTQNLFDLSHDAIGRLKNGIFDFMSTKDSDKIKSAIQLYQYESYLPTQYFQIHKDKKINYFSISGNFVPVASGQMILGVIKDITTSIESEKRLTQQNKDLIKSNTELDSFNHIASHDLQEPLRKIMMFISRVNDLGHQDLSEKVKMYLGKIESSADRMQELIKQLLAYSRIGKIGVTYEKVDLQEVFNATVQDLAEVTPDTYVIDQTNELPVIDGVAFLIHQLFFNIMANAIKYRHPDRKLHLEISSTIVQGTSITLDNTDLESNEMVELHFKDNGIGFKQEHVDKIFELFQRLHQKNEYSGTGIGLAICKKITETHHGSISAIGMLDLGCTFIVQLPIHQNKNLQ